MNHLTAPDVVAEIQLWLPVLTLIVKFLSAACGLAISALLLRHRLRRRNRRGPRA